MNTPSEYMTAARNIRVYTDLARVLRVLIEIGVAVIVLKGAVLTTTIYPDIAARSIGDLDLLVRPGDRLVAKAALEAAGYRFLPEPRQRFGPFDTTFTGEMSFFRTNGAHIDLHWELEPVEWLRRLLALDLEAVWQDALPIELEGVEVRQLSPVDTLLHLCMHLAAHGYVHPVGYADIVQLVRYDESFPWQRFVALAKARRLRTICYFALEAACTIRGAPIPPQVLAALKPPWLQRWLVRRIADPHRILAGALPANRARNYALHLAVADRPADVGRLLAWLLFPGPRWLAERYHLHGRLRPWFACLWHPLVVVWNAIAGISAVLKAA